MSVEYTVISIGTLSKNRFWNEKDQLRTPHATTTLIISDNEKILVDPALPGKVLDARLFERAGLRISDITKVFLTCFKPAHRGGLNAFDGAEWLIHEDEKDFAEAYYKDMLRNLKKGDPDRNIVEYELKLLEKCKVAKQKIARNVEIFPSPGVTPGLCSLLITEPIATIVIAGDAVINKEYLEHGQVWEASSDISQAKKSLEDIIEVADIIIPGHDNIIPLIGKLL